MPVCVVLLHVLYVVLRVDSCVVLNVVHMHCTFYVLLLQVNSDNVL